MVEAEARFRGAFDHAATGMAIVAPDGRPLRVNDALCTLSGRSAEDLLELTIAELTHPDASPRSSSTGSGWPPARCATSSWRSGIVRPDGDAALGAPAIALVRSRRRRPLYAVAQLLNVTAARPRRRAPRARGAADEKARGCPTTSCSPTGSAWRSRGPAAAAGASACCACRSGAPRWRRPPRAWRPCCGPGHGRPRRRATSSACCWTPCADDDEAEVVARRVAQALKGLRPAPRRRDRRGGRERRRTARRRRGVALPRLSRRPACRRDLRRALELEELRLAFQPVVALEPTGGSPAWRRCCAGTTSARRAAAAGRVPRRRGRRRAARGLRRVGAARELPRRWRAGAPPGWRPASRSAVNLSADGASRRGPRRPRRPTRCAARAARRRRCGWRSPRTRSGRRAAGLRRLARVGVSLARRRLRRQVRRRFPTVTRVPALAEIKVDRRS